MRVRFKGSAEKILFSAAPSEGIWALEIHSWVNLYSKTNTCIFQKKLSCPFTDSIPQSDISIILPTHTRDKQGSNNSVLSSWTCFCRKQNQLSWCSATDETNTSWTTILSSQQFYLTRVRRTSYCVFTFANSQSWKNRLLYKNVIQQRLTSAR